MEQILDSINNGAVKDIKDIYTQLDNDLAEFNMNPQAAKEDGSSEAEIIITNNLEISDWMLEQEACFI